MAGKPADSKATEQERIKKQLMVLGVLLVLVVAANAKRFMGGSARGGARRVTPAAAGGSGGIAGTAANAVAAVAAAAAPSSALTPQMIPVLDETTKKQIANIRTLKPDLVPEDVIRYETRNPFIPLALDDQEIMKKQDEANEGRGAAAQAAAQGAQNDANSASGAVYFRGIMPLQGERFAVMESPSKRVPYYVRTGENLPGTPWKLLRIGPGNAFVILYNPKATKAREKILAVPRTGISPALLKRAQEDLLREEGVVFNDETRRRDTADAMVPHMLSLAQRMEVSGGVEAPASRPPAGSDKAVPKAGDSGSASGTGKPMETHGASGSAGSSKPAADDFTFFDE